MNHESYTDTLLFQYRNALELLVKRTHVPVKQPDAVQGLRPAEHLPVPPTDGLTEIKTGTRRGGRWPNKSLFFHI